MEIIKVIGLMKIVLLNHPHLTGISRLEAENSWKIYQIKKNYPLQILD